MAEYFPRVLLSLNTDGIFYWSLLLQIIIIIIIIPDYSLTESYLIAILRTSLLRLKGIAFNKEKNLNLKEVDFDIERGLLGSWILI